MTAEFIWKWRKVNKMIIVVYKVMFLSGKLKMLVKDDKVIDNDETYYEICLRLMVVCFYPL